MNSHVALYSYKWMCVEIAANMYIHTSEHKQAWLWCVSCEGLEAVTLGTNMPRDQMLVLIPPLNKGSQQSLEKWLK